VVTQEKKNQKQFGIPSNGINYKQRQERLIERLKVKKEFFLKTLDFGDEL
jgi:hypothetical protein